MHLFVSLNKHPVPRTAEDAMKFVEDKNMTEAIELMKKSELSDGICL